MMKPFPWDQAIGFGLGVLRLTPEHFWRMTPRELAYAVAARRGPDRELLDRKTFDGLMQQFPDGQKEKA